LFKYSEFYLPLFVIVSCSVAASAAVAQPVAIEEIHWSCSYGKPPSKYGWNFGDRLRTYQEPSARCVDSK
jgi:hypothetical protein